MLQMSISSLLMKEDNSLIHLPTSGLIQTRSLLSRYTPRTTFICSPVSAKASIFVCRRSRRKYRSMIKSTIIANKRIMTFQLLQSNQQEPIASFLMNVISIQLGRNRNLIVLIGKEKLVQRTKVCANYHGGSFKSLKNLRMRPTRMWPKN
jgi:hypothetical protein